MKIELGDIFYAMLSPSVGSEQSGLRPVLIIQNNKGNKYCPTTIVIPISSKIAKRKLPTHIVLESTLGLKEKSVALVEQIRTLDKRRLLNKITTISNSDLDRVKKAVKRNLKLRCSENILGWK